MYAYVMMYVHEIPSGYARVWENKSLTVANILPGRDAGEITLRGPNFRGRDILRYSVGRPADLVEQT